MRANRHPGGHVFSRLAVLLLPLIFLCLGAHAKYDKSDECVRQLEAGTYVSGAPSETTDLLQIARKFKVRYLLLTMDFAEFRDRIQKGGGRMVDAPVMFPVFDSLMGSPIPELMATSYVMGKGIYVTPPGQWRVGFLFDAELLLRYDANPVAALDQREQELFGVFDAGNRGKHGPDYSWIDHANRDMEVTFDVVTHTRRARAMQIRFMDQVDLRAAKAIWIPKPAQKDLVLPLQDALIALGMKVSTPLLDVYEQVPPMTYFQNQVR